VEIIARATPKQDYYAQTARGNRLFELDLGPLALAICSASTLQDHKLMDQLLKDHDEVGFVIAFLRAKDFESEAEMIERTTPVDQAKAAQTISEEWGDAQPSTGVTL
jgi:type IV secretion system protein TrbE